MRSINKVLIIGNIVRDAEMRQTTSGQNVTTFTVATNREWITKDGQRHSLTEFHDVVAWARLAEICGQYLKKGKLVYIEGYLKTRSWDTPEGQKRFRTEIVAQDVIMLEKRPGNDNNTHMAESDYIPSDEEETLIDDEMVETKVEIKAEEKPEQTPPPPPEAPKLEKVEEPKPRVEEPKSTAKGSAGSISPADIDQDLGL